MRKKAGVRSRSRRVTALVWKSRVSRKRKAVVTEILRRIYPDATDKGEAVEMTVEGGCKDIWIFMLCKDFRDIRAGGGGAEYGESKGQSDNGTQVPNDPKLSDGGAWRGACPTVERTPDAQM